MPDTFLLAAGIIVTITSVLLIILSDWRVRISLLAVQYIGVFFLVNYEWSTALSISVVISGWISGAVLGMALISRRTSTASVNRKDLLIKPSRSFASRLLIYKPQSLFYLFSALILVIFSATISPGIARFLPEATVQQVWPSLILIGMGLLQIGFRIDALSTAIGLLTYLSGFTVLFSGVESSTLVAGLLAAINLGIALLGNYLLISPMMGEE